MADTKTILVPWDFTYVTNNALLHALTFVKRKSDKTVRIVLLHVLRNTKLKDVAIKELGASKTKIKEKYDFEVEVMLKEGSVFKAIDEAAQEINAVLVLMGTHGIHGMQKITGSWALKVVASSHVPFIVVQSAPKKDGYENIVFPVDFRKEGKQKLTYVSNLAKFFNSKINMFVPEVSDELIMKKINNNAHFAKKYLTGEGLDFQVTNSLTKGSLIKQTLDFARYVEADIIAIVITKDIWFMDYLFVAEEQQLIDNDLEIPIVCINPVDVMLDVRLFNSVG